AEKVRARFDLAITVPRFEEVYVRMASCKVWYQSKMPLRMKLARTIRPIAFQIGRRMIRHHLKKNAGTEVEGLKLRTNVDVFHPKYFFSSRILAAYVAEGVTRNQK